MRVLVDTNVWIAGLIAHGFSREFLDHCLSRHSVCSSEFILGELAGKLRDKFGLSAGTVAEISDFIRRQCHIADEPKGLPPAICRDPDDNRVLAAALAARADVLLTGDADLLVLKEHQGIKILNPRDFWKQEGLRAKSR